MTTVDEKEILEIEKLKLELRQSPRLFILKFYSAMVATVAVSVLVTRYFTS